MSQQLVGTTFIDSLYRKWEVISIIDDKVDCYCLDCFDGYIPNTPKFKMFPVVNGKPKDDYMRKFMSSLIPEMAKKYNRDRS